jgi:hypothetical protein
MICLRDGVAVYCKQINVSLGLTQRVDARLAEQIPAGKEGRYPM